jgi:hypothetical protein
LRDRVEDKDGNETHDFWEAVSTTNSRLIPPPTTATAGTHYQECFFPNFLGEPIARLELRLRMRPIGLDVLQDLVATGHLAPDVVDKMPTFTVDKRTARFDAANHRYITDQHSEIDCDTYRRMLAASAIAKTD